MRKIKKKREWFYERLHFPLIGVLFIGVNLLRHHILCNRNVFVILCLFTEINKQFGNEKLLNVKVTVSSHNV